MTENQTPTRASLVDLYGPEAMAEWESGEAMRCLVCGEVVNEGDDCSETHLDSFTELEGRTS